MTAITEELHRAFLRPLGDAVLRHSPAGDKGCDDNAIAYRAAIAVLREAARGKR